MLIEENRVLLVGEWKCSSLEGIESTVQGSMTETWKRGWDNILVTDGDVCFVELETVNTYKSWLENDTGEFPEEI